MNQISGKIETSSNIKLKEQQQQQQKVTNFNPSKNSDSSSDDEIVNVSLKNNCNLSHKNHFNCLVKCVIEGQINYQCRRNEYNDKISKIHLKKTRKTIDDTLDWSRQLGHQLSLIANQFHTQLRQTKAMK